jgi:hypothetical protein
MRRMGILLAQANLGRYTNVPQQLGLPKTLTWLAFKDIH